MILQRDEVLGVKSVWINEPIQTLQFGDLEVSLVSASTDGTEIILHRLNKGGYWSINFKEGFDGTEYIQIIRGALTIVKPSNKVTLMTLMPGDFLTAKPVFDSLSFLALEDTEFLYVSSQPVFHNYNKLISRLNEMAMKVELKEGFTAEHFDRMAELCIQVGKYFDFSFYNLQVLKLAAYFHDLGKTFIPDCILNKPHTLTDKEMMIIKIHSTYGKEILEEIQIPLFQQVGHIVEQHHERYDGTGYPNGLKDEEIDFKAAILAVVDSFVAMTSNRPFQKAKSVDEAMDELQRYKGTRYHPLVVDAFLSIINKCLMKKTI